MSPSKGHVTFSGRNKWIRSAMNLHSYKNGNLTSGMILLGGKQSLKKLGCNVVYGGPQEYHTGRQISVFVWMQVHCWPESLVSPTEGHMTFTWGHLKTRVKFTRFQRFLLGYEKKVFNWQIPWTAFQWATARHFRSVPGLSNSTPWFNQPRSLSLAPWNLI